MSHVSMLMQREARNQRHRPKGSSRKQRLFFREKFKFLKNTMNVMQYIFAGVPLSTKERPSMTMPPTKASILSLRTSSSSRNTPMTITPSSTITSTTTTTTTTMTTKMTTSMPTKSLSLSSTLRRTKRATMPPKASSSTKAMSTTSVPSTSTKMTTTTKLPSMAVSTKAKTTATLSYNNKRKWSTRTTTTYMPQSLSPYD